MSFAKKRTETQGPAAPESKGYLGARDDLDTGLIDLHVRTLDGIHGRFLQPDGLDPLEPGVGTNRHAHADSDPINNSDPRGRSWFGDADSIGTAIGNWAGNAYGSISSSLSSLLGSDRMRVVDMAGSMSSPAYPDGAPVQLAQLAIPIPPPLVGSPINGQKRDKWETTASDRALGRAIGNSLESLFGGFWPKNTDEDMASRPPVSSRTNGKTPWSGNHEDIKAGIGAAPDDDVRIDRDDNVWAKNPDGTWRNGGPAGDYIEGSRPSGRRGIDRESERKRGNRER